MTSQTHTHTHHAEHCHCHRIVLPNWGVREGGEQGSDDRGGREIRLARSAEKKGSEKKGTGED